jgi:hypothetical protein
MGKAKVDGEVLRAGRGHHIFVSISMFSRINRQHRSKFLKEEI